MSESKDCDVGDEAEDEGAIFKKGTHKFVKHREALLLKEIEYNPGMCGRVPLPPFFSVVGHQSCHMQLASPALNNPPSQDRNHTQFLPSLHFQRHDDDDVSSSTERSSSLSALLYCSTTQRLCRHRLSQLSRSHVQCSWRNNLQLGGKHCSNKPKRVVGVKMARFDELRPGVVCCEVCVSKCSLLIF